MPSMNIICIKQNLICSGLERKSNKFSNITEVIILLELSWSDQVSPRYPQEVTLVHYGQCIWKSVLELDKAAHRHRQTSVPIASFALLFALLFRMNWKASSISSINAVLEVVYCLTSMHLSPQLKGLDAWNVRHFKWTMGFCYEEPLEQRTSPLRDFV